jgi:hypothetical protein
VSISFVANPVACKLKHATGEGFITGDDGADWVFELYGVDGDKALILNEREFIWVELSRVHVLLSDDIPSEAEGPPPTPKIIP